MEIRDNIYGHGEEELQYLLFHKLTADPVIANEAQFYYNTTSDLAKLRISASWVYLPIVETLSSTLRIASLTNGTVSQLRQKGEGANAFIMVDYNDEPFFKYKILFSDLDSSAICTSIVSPGDNITLTTEKAVVDYVTGLISGATIVAAGNEGDIQFNASGELSGHSTLNYSYTSNVLLLSNQSHPTGEYHRLRFYSGGEGFTDMYLEGEDTFHLDSNADISIHNYSIIELDTTEVSIIAETGVSITTDVLTLVSGTANKYLYLDASNHITYVDGPTGSGTISGTVNTLAMFTNTSVLGDSCITFDGTDTITIDNNLEITGLLYRGRSPSYSFDPGVANGASAVAYILNTENTLSNAYSKILSILNNGAQKMALKGTGQLILDSYGDGTFISIAPTVYLCSTSAGLIIEQSIGVSGEFTAGTKTIRVSNGLITEIV